jgi:Fe-S oxidoreductase
VIEAIPGAEYDELHRHKHETFCCGAGGSRMWMEERMGKKVNTERTDEALASSANTLAVGCPFCNIMLSDGVNERNASEQMAVRDVAQILLESVEPPPTAAVVTSDSASARESSGASAGELSP